MRNSRVHSYSEACTTRGVQKIIFLSAQSREMRWADESPMRMWCVQLSTDARILVLACVSIDYVSLAGRVRYGHADQRTVSTLRQRVQQWLSTPPSISPDYFLARRKPTTRNTMTHSFGCPGLDLSVRSSARYQLSFQHMGEVLRCRRSLPACRGMCFQHEGPEQHTGGKRFVSISCIAIWSDQRLFADEACATSESDVFHSRVRACSRLGLCLVSVCSYLRVRGSSNIIAGRGKEQEF